MFRRCLVTRPLNLWPKVAKIPSRAFSGPFWYSSMLFHSASEASQCSTVKGNQPKPPHCCRSPLLVRYYESNCDCGTFVRYVREQKQQQASTEQSADARWSVWGPTPPANAVLSSGKEGELRTIITRRCLICQQVVGSPESHPMNAPGSLEAACHKLKADHTTQPISEKAKTSPCGNGQGRTTLWPLPEGGRLESWGRQFSASVPLLWSALGFMVLPYGRPMARLLHQADQAKAATCENDPRCPRSPIDAPYPLTGPPESLWLVATLPSMEESAVVVQHNELNWDVMTSMYHALQGHLKHHGLVSFSHLFLLATGHAARLLTAKHLSGSAVLASSRPSIVVTGDCMSPQEARDVLEVSRFAAMAYGLPYELGFFFAPSNAVALWTHRWNRPVLCANGASHAASICRMLGNVMEGKPFGETTSREYPLDPLLCRVLERPADAKPAAFPTELVMYRIGSNPQDATFALFLDHAQRQLVVAFRGTMSIRDVLTDIASGRVPICRASASAVEDCDSATSDGRLVAAAGFYHSMEKACHVLHPVLQEFRAAFSTYRVTFTGHSLGAAQALLCHLHLFDAHDPTVLSVAFAPPPCVALAGNDPITAGPRATVSSPPDGGFPEVRRVGKKDVEALCSSGRMISFVYGEDIVPRLQSSSILQPFLEAAEVETGDECSTGATPGQPKNTERKWLSLALQDPSRDPPLAIPGCIIFIDPDTGAATKIKDHSLGAPWSIGGIYDSDIQVAHHMLDNYIMSIRQLARQGDATP